MEPMRLGKYLKFHNISTGGFAKKIGANRQTVDNWLAKEDVEDYDSSVQYDVRTGIIEKVTIMKMKVVYRRGTA
jgi:hypothetical protein